MVKKLRNALYGLLWVAAAAFFVLAVPAAADTRGQQHSFFVNSKYDRLERTSLDATLHTVGEHAYFYVDDRYWNDLSMTRRDALAEKIRALALEFDTLVYPRSRELWGSERTPGIDGDPRITILLEDLVQGNGGYFDGVNNYSRSEARQSNEREMMSLNIEAVAQGFAPAFLAHEFQHLISFNQKEIQHGISEEVWLNEIRSEYSVSHAGYNGNYEGSNLARRVNIFLRNASDSLTEWPNVTTDYALAALFGEYLVGRYGSAVLSDTLRSAKTGIASLNAFLESTGKAERFADIFGDWMLASILNKSGDRVYGYANPHLSSLRVVPQYSGVVERSSVALISTSLKSWQPAWYDFTVAPDISESAGAVKITWNGETNQPFLVRYATIYENEMFDTGSATVREPNTTLYVYLRKPDSSARRIRRIVFGVTNIEKQSGFSASEPGHAFTAALSVAAEQEVRGLVASSTLLIDNGLSVSRDGDLIKRQGREQEMYVIQGKYKRYLRPDVIALYAHLAGQQPREVDDPVFNSYTTTNYIRAVSGKKVYAVWPDGTKHWLNMSAQRFTESGRDWGSIFVVNDAEANSYRTGGDITR